MMHLELDALIVSKTYIVGSFKCRTILGILLLNNKYRILQSFAQT
jgi:hypothetical protein